VEDDEPLVDRARADGAGRDGPGAVLLDPGGGHGLQREITELSIELADDEAVVGHRRRAPAAVVLDVAEVLGAGVPERRARARRAIRPAAAEVREDPFQRLLRGALREVAVGRATASRPRRPEPPVALAAVRGPVLPVEHWPRRALLDVDVSGDAPGCSFEVHRDLLTVSRCRAPGRA